jgi:hypothetical protein
MVLQKSRQGECAVGETQLEEGKVKGVQRAKGRDGKGKGKKEGQVVCRGGGGEEKDGRREEEDEAAAQAQVAQELLELEPLQSALCTTPCTTPPRIPSQPGPFTTDRLTPWPGLSCALMLLLLDHRCTTAAPLVTGCCFCPCQSQPWRKHPLKPHLTQRHHVGAEPRDILKRYLCDVWRVASEAGRASVRSRGVDLNVIPARGGCFR